MRGFAANLSRNPCAAGASPFWFTLRYPYGKEFPFMANNFVGEIRMTGFSFAPVGWFLCNGQLLPISEYEVLFQLIGTTYGGDGQTTFALPNLQGRIPIHQGSGFVMGQLPGTETVTLTLSEIPAHAHALSAQTGTGNMPSPAGGVWAGSALEQFSTAAPTSSMAALLVNTGGDQPHSNLPPYLTVNFVIAWSGIFPSQN
jgi:microcystin-dependent protein